MRPCLGLVAVSVVLCSTTGACGDNDNAGNNTIAAAAATRIAVNPTDGGFCEAMAHLIVLLSPTDDSSPTETKATFTEAAGWFERANTKAPAAIAGDVVTFKIAYEKYASYLGTVDFNLNTVFSTPEGTQLAIDTSHSLTPAIVQYAVDDCGLSFGDEQQPPPTTT